MGFVAQSERSLDTADGIALDEQTRDVALMEGNAFGGLEDGLCAKLISLFVALCPWCPNTRSFGRIEHSKLNARGVGIESHRAAESVDLANDVALGETADGGIAGHLRDGIGVLRKNESLGT